MALADRFAPRARDISSIRIKDAVIVGLAQALSLVPGTSRFRDYDYGRPLA